MKFDTIIGNPPYQEIIEKTGDNKSLATQLFPKFVTDIISSFNTYTEFIIPSRWFTADASDKSFIKLREFFKQYNHLQYIYIYNDVFNVTSIAGGVCVICYNPNYNGNTTFVDCRSSEIKKSTRPLFEPGLDIIIKDSEYCTILHKVLDHEDFESINKITTGRAPFGLVGKESFLNKISTIEPFDNAVELRCKFDEFRYISREHIDKNIELVDKYKIFSSKAYGEEEMNNNNKVFVLKQFYIGLPNQACTDSLITIGSFNTKTEAENLYKYMKTRFFRFLVGILKVSQNVSQNVYQFVPIQNFTNDSDIDWSADIKDIEIQLFNKYNLSEEDISCIYSHVKEL